MSPKRLSICPEALNNFLDATHANHLRPQLRCARRVTTVPGQMFTHSDETSDRAMFFKMTAMLDQNTKALRQAHGRGLNSYVARETQGLFNLVLGSKDPWIPLGGTAKEDSVHTRFADAATDRIHVFQVSVAKNQGRGILRDLNCAPNRLPVCVAFVALLEGPAMESDRR